MTNSTLCDYRLPSNPEVLQPKPEHGQIWKNRKLETVYLLRRNHYNPTDGNYSQLEASTSVPDGFPPNFPPFAHVVKLHDSGCVSFYTDVHYNPTDSDLFLFVGFFSYLKDSMKQIPTTTGRFSCDQPNLSNPGKEEHPPQIDMAGGKAASTKVPHIHLIPTVVLTELAKRFELGIERKGSKAWNALSKNQEVLKDREFVIERISHLINHAISLRDKLSADQLIPGAIEDAAAITWAGAFLISAVDAIQNVLWEPPQSSLPE